jgi:hypothetical protein
MTISKSKILSHTGGEYNKSLKQNNLQVTNTVNVKPTITQREISSFSSPEVKAEYPKSEAHEDLSSMVIILEKRNEHIPINDSESPELLKFLLYLYSSNLYRIGGDLIIKNEQLIEIVKLATDADDVIIELDFEVNCCASDKGSSTTFSLIF